MAQITLGDVLSFTQDYLPDIPVAKVCRKFNLILQDIYDTIAQVSRTTVTTMAPVTTGTVNVTLGSTTATFSSGVVLSADPYRLVQIEGVSEWFTLTRGAGDTNGVLSSKWPTTSNATATFKIVYPTISFPAAVSQVLSMRREGYDPLEYASDTNAAERAISLTPGIPRWFAPFLYDSAATPDDAHRILLTPPPDDEYVYQVAYVTRPTLLSTSGGTSQTVPLPALFNKAVYFGTLALCMGQDDGEGGMGPWWNRYTKALQDALATMSVEHPKQQQSVYDRGKRMFYYDTRPL